MPTVLSLIKDQEAFIGACKYSIKLLGKSKFNPKGFENFTKETELIVEIIKKTQGDDVVTIEILRLIKCLIKLQMFLRVNVITTIEIDFHVFMKRSIAIILESLSLLLYVLKSQIKYPLLRLSETHVLELFMNLLRMNQTEVVDEAYKSLLHLLKKKKFLNFSNLTFAYVKWKCGQPTDLNEEFVKKFLMFLRNWLSFVVHKEVIFIPVDDISRYLKKLNDEYIVCIFFIYLM